jgi:hypothetical protein
VSVPDYVIPLMVEWLNEANAKYSEEMKKAAQ